MKGRLLLLLLLPLVRAEGAPSEGDCSKNPIIGFEGKDAVLEPVVIGTPTYITWKKEENIVYEWDRNSDHSNGNLIIKSVSHNDGGVYTAEIQIGTEIEYKHFCLKILEYLEPPVLDCSDHGDDIQVNCTSPPQIYSHNLSVSYHWERMGKVFDHGQSIKLQKHGSLPEKITCIISIYNVRTNMSITLAGCLSKEPDKGRSRPGWWAVLVVFAAITVFGFYLWKKDRSTHWFLCDIRKRKSQEDPGNADVPLNEMPTNNDPRCVPEDSNDNRSKGNGEDVPLNETLDDSKYALENAKDDRGEGNHIPLEKLEE